jgi:hypothetical protein
MAEPIKTFDGATLSLCAGLLELKADTLDRFPTHARARALRESAAEFRSLLHRETD